MWLQVLGNPRAHKEYELLHRLLHPILGHRGLFTSHGEVWSVARKALSAWPCVVGRVAYSGWLTLRSHACSQELPLQDPQLLHGQGCRVHARDVRQVEGQGGCGNRLARASLCTNHASAVGVQTAIAGDAIQDLTGDCMPLAYDIILRVRGMCPIRSLYILTGSAYDSARLASTRAASTRARAITRASSRRCTT